MLNRIKVTKPWHRGSIHPNYWFSLRLRESDKQAGTEVTGPGAKDSEEIQWCF
ncbi:hypothetical protein [Jannaschia seohaensis]|uniref:hypothetical protein n=1 Tax=Jannaschia seohaensis TaxID=475081 RepID=UPI00147476B6|nr:hypothetical protein [Jannaschia seohaensis]